VGVVGEAELKVNRRVGVWVQRQESHPDEAQLLKMARAKPAATERQPLRDQKALARAAARIADLNKRERKAEAELKCSIQDIRQGNIPPKSAKNMTLDEVIAAARSGVNPYETRRR
jgi:hypothetical protein